MREPLLAGISSQMVDTARLRTHVLTGGRAHGAPLGRVEGNVSSNRFFEETMLALPQAYRAVAPDLRGYGLSEAQPIDATRGVRDWSDDLKALATALGLRGFHLVGWSLGGNVAMQYAVDHPADLLSLTLIAPGSPFGFGGTRDVQGTPTWPDFAGSGGGTANPEFVRRLGTGDRSGDSPFSPRNVMNTYYFKPPFRAAPAREEVFVSSLLAMRLGDGFYPGDMTPSPNWPTLAPGVRGNNNALAPKYPNQSALAGINPRPPILWVRGADDQIVSDTSLFEFGFLGQIGAVPGWPGPDVYPAQPMIGQIRNVLERYRVNGGRYTEQVIADCAHSPHIEHPREFMTLLTQHLANA